jgi:transcriptional regulator with XRE-family HTH domain
MKLSNPHPTVKELRESKGLRRRDVALVLDVADSTVLRWEQGAREPHLPLRQIKKLLELFDCDFDTLYKAFEETAAMKAMLDDGQEFYVDVDAYINYEPGEPEASEEEEEAFYDHNPVRSIKNRLSGYKHVKDDLDERKGSIDQ